MNERVMIVRCARKPAFASDQKVRELNKYDTKVNIKTYENICMEMPVTQLFHRIMMAAFAEIFSYWLNLSIKDGTIVVASERFVHSALYAIFKNPLINGARENWWWIRQQAHAHSSYWDEVQRLFILFNTTIQNELNEEYYRMKMLYAYQ